MEDFLSDLMITNVPLDAEAIQFLKDIDSKAWFESLLGSDYYAILE